MNIFQFPECVRKGAYQPCKTFSQPSSAAHFGILLDQQLVQLYTRMAHHFIIQFTIRTVEGFEPLCDFYVGEDRPLAHSIFSQLEGNDEVLETAVLQVNLLEIKDGLPFDVKIKHCTLSQMGASCCYIAKEIFKYRNLVRGI